MEGQRLFSIPNFSDPRCSVNGNIARYETKKDVALSWLRIRVFLNGKSPENEGHVSFVLHIGRKMDISYLNCIVSVVDANGSSRYPQSFGVQGGVFEECSTLEEVNFVKRCVVLDPDKELLHEDTLTLQFDISYDIKTLNHVSDLSDNELDEIYLENVKSSENNQQYLRGIDLFDQESESYVHNDSNSDYVIHGDEYPRFPIKHPFVSNLRHDDNPLCERLGHKPRYFELSFRKAANKNNCKDFTSFTWRSITADLIIFLQQENLEHVDSVDKCIALYYLSHKYGMIDLKVICRERIKCLLTSENAVEILDVAQLCKDGGLLEYATVHILLDWKKVKNSKQWAVLHENCPVLVKGVSRVANDVEVQSSCIEVGLRRAVMQFVFLNWDEVQKYAHAVWTTKIQKLIASCLRKDFNSDFLNLNEFDPVEKYTQHIEDYNFYR